jgi:hypothetical protein
MHTIAQSTRGLRILLRINWDRILYGLTIILALTLGSWAGNAWLH